MQGNHVGKKAAVGCYDNWKFLCVELWKICSFLGQSRQYSTVLVLKKCAKLLYI